MFDSFIKIKTKIGLSPKLTKNHFHAIIQTFEYAEINPFKNGLAIVSKGNNKYGVINKYNAKIAPCIFKSIKHSEDTNLYEITDTSNNQYNLNSAGDCVSANSAKFYELVRKANQK